MGSGAKAMGRGQVRRNGAGFLHARQKGRQAGSSPSPHLVHAVEHCVLEVARCVLGLCQGEEGGLSKQGGRGGGGEGAGR
jgi:hypothetical protein